MWETWVQSLGWEDPLEEGKATYSTILAWRIPWTIQSMWLQRVRHDWVIYSYLGTCIASWLELCLPDWAAPAGRWLAWHHCHLFGGGWCPRKLLYRDKGEREKGEWKAKAVRLSWRGLESSCPCPHPICIPAPWPAHPWWCDSRGCLAWCWHVSAPFPQLPAPFPMGKWLCQKRRANWWSPAAGKLGVSGVCLFPRAVMTITTTWQLKTTEMYSLPVQEARSPKPSVGKFGPPLGPWRKTPSMLLSWLLVAAGDTDALAWRAL